MTTETQLLADIPGNADEVRAISEWLDRFAKAVDGAGEHTLQARQTASRSWEGASGDAYYDLAVAMLKATDELRDRANKASDVVRSYSQQLRWRQDDMADHRLHAHKAGLAVNGTVIIAPEPALAVPDLPGGASQAEQTAWEQALLALQAAGCEDRSLGTSRR